MSYTTISVGGITLTVVKLNKRRIPSQIVQKMGKSLVFHDIPGRDAVDWIIDIEGVITNSIGTTRTNIEALEDANKHHYSDGLITASVVLVPNTLVFSDSAEENPLHYLYSLQIRQVQND
jgi:hypothetical protein